MTWQSSTRAPIQVPATVPGLPLRERPENVAPAYDAHWLELIIDDGNARNIVGEKQTRGIGNLGVPAQGDRFAGHDLMNVFVECCDVPGALHRAANEGAQCSKQIAVRDDAP